MEIRRMSLDEWGEALPDRGFEPFHAPAALSVLDDHAPGDLHLLGGYKGQQVVGLLPAFVRSTPAGRAVVSPPPGMMVPRLGPLVMPASPKRRKRERVTRRFVEGVLDELSVGGRLTVTRIVAPAEYRDPRPFDWQSMSVSPAFTYRVDASDPESTKAAFSKSLRRNLRDARDLGVTVERADDCTAAVYGDVRDRYEDQGDPFRITREYVTDLVDALGDRARTFVARDPGGEYLSGVVALYSSDAAYFWLGGAKTTYEGTSVNGLVHWRILRDVAEDPPVDTATEYDLVGANTERLCKYKAQFGGRLVPYYVAESGGALTPLAKTVYRFTDR